MAKESQGTDADNSMRDASVHASEQSHSRLTALLHAVDRPADDSLGADQEEFIRLLSDEASPTSSLHHEVLQCISALFTRAKRDFSRDMFHLPPGHFTFQSFSTGCSYLYTHAASVNAAPLTSPMVMEVRRIVHTLLGFQPCFRTTDGTMNLHVLVTAWKNTTKLCKTFSAHIAIPENAPAIANLIGYVQTSALDTVRFLDGCLSTALPLDSTAITHNIQGARVLFKALQGLVHTFANVMSSSEIERYWGSMGHVLAVLLPPQPAQPLDPACRQHWTSLVDDVSNCIQASLSLGDPTTERGLKTFETGLLGSIQSTDPSDQVLHLLAAYARYCVERTPSGEWDDCRHVAAWDGILTAQLASTGLQYQCTMMMTLGMESMLRLLFDANQHGSQALQLRLLQHTFQSDSISHRPLCRVVWMQALHLWNQFDDGGGGGYSDDIVRLLLDLMMCDDDNLDMAHRITIGDLIVDLSVAMHASQKMLIVDSVSTVVERICADGPSHAFGRVDQAKLCLLERFSRSLLDGVDDAYRVVYTEKYMRMCYECCGTAVQIIEQASDDGLWRIVDATLLVLGGIFSSHAVDDSTDDDDVQACIAETMPMLLQVLDQLATLTCPPGPSQRRIVHTSRSLLTSFHHGLKRNQQNHLVVLLDALLRLAQWPSMGVAVAGWMIWLGDVQVPPHMDEFAAMLWKHYCKVFFALLGSSDWPVVCTTLEAISVVLSDSSLPLQANGICQDLHEAASVLSEYIDIKYNKETTTADPAKLRKRTQSQLDRLGDACARVKRACSMHPRLLDDHKIHVALDNVTGLLDNLVQTLEMSDR
ncbi:hypothetical protein H257_17614 [Aphanomyces astaci]|uniref:Uncharacterized protein n=1 Tax=Aphanomyces astaci TaxID=112090 RepID=W4FFT0_APHAT|nr:hypothetical protein H257_17614 [Aphanomyces astaci]ETV65729.1 hypothetical protein H257_17614 [Aphanomyces astaci]|eukprot:XP_009844781.1 hypothetical protein H257_17614 [Aphanomyces astaci]